MAFKTVEQFNEDRYRNLFRIINDKESADVVFLYQSRKDMLVADAHYIKSANYSGYVHCCGEGCPACAIKKSDGTQAIRTQTKIFIPVYNINKNEGEGAIEFWDRTPKFEPQFKQEVFDLYANPSEYVFKVTRHGAVGDVNTHYSMRAVGRNTVPGMSYGEILQRFNAKMPDYYENIIKSVSISELAEMLQSQDTEGGAITQEYVPVPRAGYQSSIPSTFVNDSNSPDASAVLDTAEVDNGDEELPDPEF